MKDLTYEPFSQGGLGRLHLDGVTIIVAYQLALLFPNAIGGGFLLDARKELLGMPEHGRHRLQIGAERALEIITGRPNGKHIPIISLGLVDAKPSEGAQ